MADLPLRGGGCLQMAIWHLVYIVIPRLRSCRLLEVSDPS